MTKFKIQNKSKIQMSNVKTNVLSFVICALVLFCHLCFGICHLTFAQEPDLEFTLDVNSETIALPKIFKPNIDLSGRGSHRDATWPQTVAAREVLDTWAGDIGFTGIYRLQYNLWEIHQLVKDKELQDKLLGNYENIIKKISDAGGIVILDIFGTPSGLGRVLDKKSPPWDLRAFKELVKLEIRNLSCNKRYNIWYEVWSAPDLDEFFLGRKQEYLNLYRAVAEGIKELEAETKIHIPLGGPGVSWWFQNLDGNTIITPERSLIYELIKFCYHYHLPLNFISWHAYSTDPQVEKATTVYRKTGIQLMRDWLTYFNFDRDIPLLINEWNYDRQAHNILTERKEESYICASYIPSRLKNMYESGLNYQLYFSLEDFHHNKEDVTRNTGIFWFDAEASDYKGQAKSIYNVFKMLTYLGDNMFLSPFKLKDEFVGVIASKSKDYVSLLIYSYLDPEIFMSYLSKNIASLKAGERKALINLIRNNTLSKIMQGQLNISGLRLSNKIKKLLERAQELNAQAQKFKSSVRNIKINIKNLNPVRNTKAMIEENKISNGVKGDYVYQRYIVDSSCANGCKFGPLEEKEVTITDLYQDTLMLKPYSVTLLILKPKPQGHITTQNGDTTTGNPKE